MPGGTPPCGGGKAPNPGGRPYGDAFKTRVSQDLRSEALDLIRAKGAHPSVNGDRNPHIP